MNARLKFPTSELCSIHSAEVESLKDMCDEILSGNLNAQAQMPVTDLMHELGQRFLQMRDKLRKRTSDLNTLNVATETLAAQKNAVEVFETALATIQIHMGFEAGAAYMFNDEGYFELVSEYPTAYEEDEIWDEEDDGFEMEMEEDAPFEFRPILAMDHALVQQMRDKKMPVYSDCFAMDTYNGILEHCVLCVPLMDNLKLKGLLYLIGAPNGALYFPEDDEFVITIAKMSMITNNNLRMMREIEEHSQSLEAKVKERTAAIKDLMDNTGQGFLSFGSNLIISAEYSKPCETFFKGKIDGIDAINLLFGKPFMPPEEHRKRNQAGDLREIMEIPGSTKEVLNMLFKGVSGMDVLGDLLPKETTIDGRILSVDYRAIESEGSQKMMLILTDVTKERQLALQIAEDEERNATILKVALDRDGFIQFLNELEKLFLDVYTQLNLSVSEIDVSALFRSYHTIKGGTANYGLGKVSKATHDIEATLEDVRSGKQPLTEFQVHVLLRDTVRLQSLLTQSLDELEQVISKEDRRQTGRVYRVEESKFHQAMEELGPSIPQEFMATVQRVIDSLRMQPISSVLQKYKIAAEGLAARLKKNIKVELEGGKIEIFYDRLESLFGSLVHLVRNCVDHGVEESDIRVMLGKPEMGHLKISAATENRDLVLTIADDGGGIDPDVIRNIALKKGIIDQTKADAMSEEEIIHLIFAPGFSTKEQVTAVSGRGVGMDAVKTETEKLGGQIEIHTLRDEGTTFKITIPDVT